MSLVVKSDEGLIVLAGCAHRGIINTLHRAREVTGVKRIKGVGFKLPSLFDTEDRVNLFVVVAHGNLAGGDNAVSYPNRLSAQGKGGPQPLQCLPLKGYSNVPIGFLLRESCIFRGPYIRVGRIR